MMTLCLQPRRSAVALAAAVAIAARSLWRGRLRKTLAAPAAEVLQPTDVAGAPRSQSMAERRSRPPAARTLTGKRAPGSKNAPKEVASTLRARARARAKNLAAPEEAAGIAAAPLLSGGAGHPAVGGGASPVQAARQVLPGHAARAPQVHAAHAPEVRAENVVFETAPVASRGRRLELEPELPALPRLVRRCLCEHLHVWMKGCGAFGSIFGHRLQMTRLPRKQSSSTASMKIHTASIMRPCTSTLTRPMASFASNTIHLC
mmetsp:Transcript_96203/g.181032  ORF Transcript_96203/g.181032 Transcript_96203/m.181032 type:complete len:261 (-) Transcript_96203:1596-2378(-)